MLTGAALMDEATRTTSVSSTYCSLCWRWVYLPGFSRMSYHTVGFPDSYTL